MSQIRRHALPLLVAIGAASLVAACGREGSEPTVGERVDQGVAQMGKKAAEAQGSISDAGKAAGQAAQGTAKDLADSTRDAAISAKITSELLRDGSLRVAQIDVDTVQGRVVLRGSAPDTAARERATQLARSVDGVVAVDNELKVEPMS